MSLHWIDFLVGFLLLESTLILSLTYSGQPYLNIFGKSPKFNIYSSILLTIATLEFYIYNYDITTLLNNGVLLGVTVMYFSYLVIGRRLHKRLKNHADYTRATTITTK